MWWALCSTVLVTDRVGHDTDFDLFSAESNVALNPSQLAARVEEESVLFWGQRCSGDRES